MRRFAPELSVGVLATLIGDWLAKYALHLPPAWRWSLVAGVGVAAALITAVVRAPAEGLATRILTNVRARRARVKGLHYRDDGSGELDLLTGIRVEGDLDVEDLNVERGGRRDA